jgi:hypothetical protein
MNTFPVAATHGNGGLVVPVVVVVGGVGGIPVVGTGVGGIVGGIPVAGAGVGKAPGVGDIVAGVVPGVGTPHTTMG